MCKNYPEPGGTPPKHGGQPVTQTYVDIYIYIRLWVLMDNSAGIIYTPMGIEFRGPIPKKIIKFMNLCPNTVIFNAFQCHIL